MEITEEGERGADLLKTGGGNGERERMTRYQMFKVNLLVLVFRVMLLMRESGYLSLYLKEGSDPSSTEEKGTREGCWEERES